MVNLPPDQPSPAPQPEARRPDRILEFDELLALVLAFLGIGSILWWGLSRSPRMLAGLGQLERRASAPRVITPEAEAQTGIFEPRRLDPDQRTSPVSPDGTAGQPELGPGRRRSAFPPAAVVPGLPAAPQATPAEPSGAEGTQPLDISDVPPTHWAYPFIRPMFDQGYLPDLPDSGFQPDQPLTRAELAALLSQAFGDAPREGTALAFDDVPDSYWAASAIDNAVAQGFMNGYPEGDFRPDQAVPRYEVLVSLATGLDLSPPPVPDQTLQAFVDLGPLPGWARSQVAAAVDRGLVVNYPSRDRLQPTQAATRAEIVAMIHQALVEQGELPAVESEYTVP
ncbi:MAG: S-layer homology domain-containing protein [Leptolyngbya sp. DLM2.Bin27]|nr:MAG: S-layer homology domain-containing protein [Leptolyngbya sp. DLM2.Bin27]